MSLLDVIDALQTGSYTVNRGTSNGYDSHGRAIADTVTTFTIVAGVQPLTGKDLMALPEGQRSEQTQWLWTATELRTRQTAQAPDVVIFGGEPWVCQSIETWVSPDETFYRVRISRKSIP